MWDWTKLRLRRCDTSTTMHSLLDVPPCSKLCAISMTKHIYILRRYSVAATLTQWRARAPVGNEREKESAWARARDLSSLLPSVHSVFAVWVNVFGAHAIQPTKTNTRARATSVQYKRRTEWNREKQNCAVFVASSICYGVTRLYFSRNLN